MFHSKSLKGFGLFFTLNLFLSLTSCSNDLLFEPDFAESQLYGIWTDTVKSVPIGMHLNRLMFSANGSFSYTNANLGMFEGQTSADFSFFFEEQGSYVLSAGNIYFLSKKRIEWNFMTQKNPLTTETDKVIFESCTYQIEENLLTLSYIAQQGDKQKTIRKYKRVEMN